MTGADMHDGEIRVDPMVVARLVASQFPRWAHLSVVPIPSAGTDNSMLRLGDDMLVRLPRIDWAVADVCREQEWLPRLAPHLPFAVPTPLAMGEPEFGYPWRWSVYRWLNGANPTVDALDDPLGLARDLAHFTTALQRIDISGGPVASRGEPLHMREEATREAMGALTDVVDAGAVGRAWDDALRAPAWDGEPVWIHGDLAAGNLAARRRSAQRRHRLRGSGGRRSRLRPRRGVEPPAALRARGLPQGDRSQRGHVAAWGGLGVVDRAHPAAVLRPDQPVPRGQRAARDPRGAH